MEKAQKRKSFALGYSYVGLGFLLQLTSTAFIGAGLSTLIIFLVQKTHMPTGPLTSVNTMGALVGTVCYFFASQLMRKVGTRPLIAGGVLLMAVATFLWSVCFNIGTFILIAILSQVSVALFIGAISALVVNWFPRTKGTALGVTSVGTTATTFTYIALITAMAPKWGFDNFMRGTSLVLLLLAVACWFLIKEKPEDVGLLPDNRPLDAVDVSKDKTGYNEAEADKGTWKTSQIIFSKQGILYMVAFGTYLLCVRGNSVAKIPFFRELGYDPMTTVWLASIIAIVATLGGILIGWLDSKFGTKKAMLVSSFACLIAYFFTYFIAPVSPIMAVIGMGLVYFVHAGPAVLIPSMLGTNFGRKNFAQAFGILYMGVSLVTAFSYLGVGAIITKFGSYNPTNLLFGVLMIVSFVTTLFLAPGYISSPNKPKE